MIMNVTTAKFKETAIGYIPEEWSVDEIANFSVDIIDGDRGVNYPKNHELKSDGFCVFLNNKNIKNDKFDFTEPDFITEGKDKLLRSGKLQPDDIIITTRGSVGNVAFFSADLPYKHVRINSGMIIIRNYQKHFDPKFLYALLKSPLLKNQYKEYSTGSAQPQLPIKDLKHINLLKPPLAEQKIIGEIVSSIDKKVNLDQQISRNLSDIGQSLLREWFINMNCPFIKDERGWMTIKLGDLIKKNNKKLKSKDEWENQSVIDLSVMPNFSLFLNEFSSGSDFETNIFELKEYDILFGSIRPYFGKTGFSPINGAVTGTVFSFLPKKKIFYAFVLFLVTSKSFIEFTIQHSRGTKMPIIAWRDFCDYEISVPVDEEVVAKFNDLAFPIIEMIGQSIQETISLKIIGDSLLPRLMNGNIRVPINN